MRARRVIAVAACGENSNGAVDDPAPPEADEAPSFTGAEGCEDTPGVGSMAPPGSLCPAGFTLDGTFYSVSCGPVRPETVTDDVLARGVYSGDATELRRVADTDPRYLVAIQVDGGACGDGDDVLSAWSMAFPEGAAQRPEMTEAVCRIAFEQHLAREHCGRSVAYVIRDSDENGTVDFPDLVPLVVGTARDEPTERIRSALIGSTEVPAALLTEGARPVPTISVEGALVVLDFSSEHAAEELAIWSTSAGSTALNAILGMVFENAPDAQVVEHHLDGSCTAFTETMQGAGCQQNTRDRWAQYKVMTPN